MGTRGRSTHVPLASRRWLFPALALLAAGVGLAVAVALRRGQSASVLLFTLDTLRADHVGAYGSREVRTPHLDALASRGLLFEQALSSTPLTLPSHATILTGVEPPHHGVRNNGTHALPEARATLATLLKASGYATGAFVGAYVLDHRFGLSSGFDRYDDDVVVREESASVLDSDRPCEEVAQAATAWIAAQRTPFLAWVHFYDPHAPYRPPTRWEEQYPGRPYEGEVAYTDDCVGRVVAAAQERAGARLLIAVLGDHGEGRNDHGERTHGYFVYDSTLRVPFILSGPGIPSGQRRVGPARTADVLPTLLQLLSLPAPSGLDGAALGPGPAPAEAYAETVLPQTLGWSPLYSLRFRNLKYIEAPRPELYDLAADPGEAKNIVSERPLDADRLRKALAAFRGDDRPWATAVPTDRSAMERLRALGYVAGGPPPPEASQASLKDPKDTLELWRLFEESLWAEAHGDRATAAARLRELIAREPGNQQFRNSLARLLVRPS